MKHQNKTINKVDIHELLTWFNPSYPIGSYAYSHGIEYAIEEGLINNSNSLHKWVRDLLIFGTGYNDSIIINILYNSIVENNLSNFDDIVDIAYAMRPTKEISLESAQQGISFYSIIREVYNSNELNSYLRRVDSKITYPVITGIIGGYFQLEKHNLIYAYLYSFASNLLSAALRIMSIGQTEIQKIIYKLKKDIEKMTMKSQKLNLSDLGSSVLFSDWSSAKHEFQYSRLFRSWVYQLESE